MTTAYTSLLGLALPVTGELSGTWGDTVNTAITSLLDTAVAGTTSITTDADITLSTTTGASNQARQAIILWNPASGTTTRNITAPAQSKMYVVINASGGTQSIVIRGAGPTTGVTIAKGESATVAWNGSDFVKVSSSGGAITFTDLTVTGNTILGDAAADTLTVNATSTFASPVSFQGLVRLPSTGRSAAAALTVTAPAFLYGVASTYTDTTSSGTIAAMAPFYSIAQPTLSTSNVTTYTNAATLYLANAPTAGGSATITNPYALYIAAGDMYFGGNLRSNLTFSADNTYDIGASGATRPRNLYLAGNEVVAGTVTWSGGTANGVLYLNGSKVATSGSALTFDGTALTSLNNSSAQSIILSRSSATARNWALGIDGDGGFRLTDATGSNVFLSIIPSGVAYLASASELIFKYNTSVEGMRLTSNGLGIGTSSPSQKLQVTGAIYANNSTNVAFLMQGSQYNGSIANTSGTNTYSLGYSTNASTHTSVLYWNALGSVSVGIAPSAFTNGWSAIQIGSSALSYSGTGSFTSTQISDNAYFIGSGSDTVTANYIYGSTPATNYKQYNGQHRWYNAGSGTAGSAISFTQAMTLSSGGLLSVGTTNASGATIRGLGGSNATAYYYLDANGPFGGSPSYSSILGFALYTDSGARYNSAAEIACISDSNYSGSLAFSTQNPGTYPNTVTERVRITSGGVLVANPNGGGSGNKLRVIGGGSGALGAIEIGDGSLSGGSTNYWNIGRDNNVSGAFTFALNGSEVSRFTTSGEFLVGATSSASSKARFTRTDGGNVLYVSQEAATNYSTAAIYQTQSGGNNNQNIGLIVAIEAQGTGDRIICAQYYNSGSPQNKFYVQRDGSTYNATGVYGTISDVRVKQDITNASSQWEDFKKIKFRKFRMIDDVEKYGNKAPYLMGPVAQELEEAGMKGLVETPVDKDGNETDLHKTVKLSIMHMKGMKALQEAMERIEQLEARLAAANL
jgi:hypothetical protein